MTARTWCRARDVRRFARSDLEGGGTRTRSDTVGHRRLSSPVAHRTEPNVSVGVIIEHHVRPGSRDAVRAIWEEHLRPAIAANAAHEAYAYMFDVDDPDVIRAFQQ